MNLKFTLEAVNKYANDPDKKAEVVELLSYEPGPLSTQIWLKCFAGFYPFPALSGLESYYVKQRIGAAQATLGAYWKELNSINPSNGGWGDLEKFREFLTAMTGLTEKFSQHHLNPVWKLSNL